MVFALNLRMLKGKGVRAFVIDENDTRSCPNLVNDNLLKSPDTNSDPWYGIADDNRAFFS